jgi:hypothetical protein
MKATTAATCAALAIGVAIGLPSRRALAEDKADCSIFEISATNAKDPKDAVIDPELRPLEKKLKKPPFGSWNTFHQLSRVNKTLVRLKPETIKLKDGGATVLLREITGPKARLGLTITMDDASGKRLVDTKVIVDAADYLVVGRSLPNNDGHLLALTCK